MNQPAHSQGAHAKVSQSEALVLAQNECRKHGWPWLQPVKVWSRRGKWIIHTNYESRGANVRLAIDQDTGEISETTYMPR